jgi:hypothetical protein
MLNADFHKNQFTLVMTPALPIKKAAPPSSRRKDEMKAGRPETTEPTEA